jgi:transcriptional regulator with AAA-type ATPase domain
MSGTRDAEESADTADDGSRRADPIAERWDTQLVVALECDRPLAGAARFSLDGVHEVIIGRGGHRSAVRTEQPGFTRLTIRVPSATMSATHARLVRAGDRWCLEDAHSHNGSFVNGERVVRAEVGSDDILELGHVVFRLSAPMPMLRSPADLDVATISPIPPSFRTLIPALENEFDKLRRLAATNVPILLLGETGTGKEVVARALHAISGRAGAMVPVNCGALPQSLAEAQLFGHVKGAFSGAHRDEAGFVRAAHDGTLFLDEIGDLPLASQTVLLRVLQGGEVTPIGTSRATQVDVRVISATHQALRDDGVFRSDLYARLAGFVFHMPPLHERILDFGVVFASVLSHAGVPAEQATVAPELALRLFRHSWPFNVRELQQGLRTALALSEDGCLRSSHFPSLSDASPRRPRATAAAESATVRRATPHARPTQGPSDDERLRLEVLGHLESSHGNVAAVGRAMGKAPMQIRRWLLRFGIDPSGFRRTL